MKALCIGGPWDGCMVDTDRGAAVTVNLGVKALNEKEEPIQHMYTLFHIHIPGFALAFYVAEDITSTAALHKVFAHYNRTVAGGRTR